MTLVETIIEAFVSPVMSLNEAEEVFVVEDCHWYLIFPELASVTDTVYVAPVISHEYIKAGEIVPPSTFSTVISIVG